MLVKDRKVLLEFVRVALVDVSIKTNLWDGWSEPTIRREIEFAVGWLSGSKRETFRQKFTHHTTKFFVVIDEFLEKFGGIPHAVLFEEVLELLLEQVDASCFECF